MFNVVSILFFLFQTDNKFDNLVGMATRNTAKYGGELARLLNALTGSPEHVISTQDTLTDILEKVSLRYQRSGHSYRYLRKGLCVCVTCAGGFV